ncbi:hypothetical protein [Enterococcus phage vB_EfaS_785CS]|uniref:Uncharacterized protein n=1 Tax=Enterococcus phage vB_EfaS_785CS TaxID=2836121 RepID=A0A8E7D9J3_9CAUD|nr:hypothetical protein [Enterococcus phage vB_EfaS_785CS]
MLFMREEIRISEIMKQSVKRLILLKRNQFLIVFYEGKRLF